MNFDQLWKEKYYYLSQQEYYNAKKIWYLAISEVLNLIKEESDKARTENIELHFIGLEYLKDRIKEL